MTPEVRFTYSLQDVEGTWLAAAWLDNRKLAERRLDVYDVDAAKLLFRDAAKKMPDSFGDDGKTLSYLYDRFEDAVRVFRPLPASEFGNRSTASTSPMASGQGDCAMLGNLA